MAASLLSRTPTVDIGTLIGNQMDGYDSFDSFSSCSNIPDRRFSCVTDFTVQLTHQNLREQRHNSK